MEVKKYDKLIRDKTPEILLRKGYVSKIRKIKNDEEFRIYLQKKVLEEALEVAEASDINKLKEEISDVVGITNRLMVMLNISKREIGKIIKLKNKNRGGFSKRLILIKTER